MKKYLVLLLAIIVLVSAQIACGETEIVPEPTVMSGPTATPEPTPYWTTVPAIENAADAMTDLQKDQYYLDALGETVRFNGKVQEVHSDGSVTLDGGENFWSVIRLENIPMDFARTLNKDQYISGEGTLSGVENIILLTFAIDVTTIE